MSYGSIPKASLKWDTSYLDYVIISYTGNTTSTSTTIYSTSILDGSYTSPDLSFNTKYTFLLTPYYNGNMGAINTMIMDTTPPIAGVYSDSISTSSSVQLNWITSNYNYVKISRSTQNDTYVDISTNVIGSQYLDTDISGNGTYNYKITPYMDDIPYSTSSPITVYTNIQSPANLTISSYDSSSVTVSFIEPKNYYTSSAVYTVYTTDASASGTSSPLLLTGLTTNTSYNIFGNVVLDGTNAAAMTGNVMITTYGIINSFTVGTIASTSVVLSWTGTYSNVIIYYGTSSGSTTYNTGIKGGTTTTITGLTSGSTYYFNIYPYNSNGIVGTKYNTEVTNINTTIQNGSFLLPEKTASFTTILSVGENLTNDTTTVPYWTTTTTGRCSLIISRNGSAFYPSSGNPSYAQSLSMQLFTSTILITQSIYLFIGTYTLSFYGSYRKGYGTAATLTISIGSNTLVSTLSLTQSNWVLYTYSFTISSASINVLSLYATCSYGADSTINITGLNLNII